MRKLVYECNVSLDGFADHTAAGVVDDELHYFFSGLLDDTDIELFGRVTYQLMESYWPFAHEDPKANRGMLEFADKFNAIPKIVFSNSLQKADWNNTKLIKGDAVEEVKKLKQQPGKNISIGGIHLASTLMNAGLIDEFWILIHPVIVGKGRRLFEEIKERQNLKLVETKKLNSGVVALHYLSIKK